MRVKNNWYSVPPKYIGEQLTICIDPLSQQAEVTIGEVSIRTFAINLDEQNRRYSLPEHSQALKALWRKQYKSQTPGKRVIPNQDVDVRSPEQYEKLFSVGVAS